MKWLKALTFLLAVLIVSSATGLIIFANIYSRNEGEVEGTGFIKQEFFGAGGYHYDVDDYGEIYFTIQNKGVVIYNEFGDYKYTLKQPSSGALSVKIDDQNNILVYDIREQLIYHYSDKGLLVYTEGNLEPSVKNELSRSKVEVEREKIIYIRKNRTITRVENDNEKVVFTVPIWQRWYRAFNLILIFSSIALFLRFGVAAWLKAYYGS